MKGRPSCWKITSWPNWKDSIVGYSPWPLPAHVPISQASRAQLGWMFSGISNGIGSALSRVGGGVGGIHLALHPAQQQHGHHADGEHGGCHHHDDEGFHAGESRVEPCAVS